MQELHLIQAYVKIDPHSAVDPDFDLKQRSIKTQMSEFGVKELDWSTESPDISCRIHLEGFRADREHEPDLPVHHQCLTSQITLFEE